MYILREIVDSPWFYWPFAGIGLWAFVASLTQGTHPGQALVTGIVVGGLWAFIVSGLHRLYARSRHRGP